MFMVLRTTTADENLSQGAPVARPATGKRLLAVPHAGGVRHSQKSSSTAQRDSFHLRRSPPPREIRIGRLPGAGRACILLPSMTTSNIVRQALILVLVCACLLGGSYPPFQTAAQASAAASDLTSVSVFARLPNTG